MTVQTMDTVPRKQQKASSKRSPSSGATQNSLRSSRIGHGQSSSRLCVQLDPKNGDTRQVVVGNQLNAHLKVQDVKQKHTPQRIRQYLKNKWKGKIFIAEDQETETDTKTTWILTLFDPQGNRVDEGIPFGEMLSQDKESSSSLLVQLQYEVVRKETARTTTQQTQSSSLASALASTTSSHRQQHTEVPHRGTTFFTPEDPSTMSKVVKHSERLFDQQDRPYTSQYSRGDGSSVGSVVRNLLGSSESSGSPNNSPSSSKNNSISPENRTSRHGKGRILSQLIADLCRESKSRADAIKQQVGTENLSSLQLSLIGRIEEAVDDLQCSVRAPTPPDRVDGNSKSSSASSFNRRRIRPQNVSAESNSQSGVYPVTFTQSSVSGLYEGSRTMEAKRKRITPTNLSPTPLSHAVDDKQSRHSDSIPDLSSTRVPLPQRGQDSGGLGNGMHPLDGGSNWGEGHIEWSFGEGSRSNNSATHSTSIGFDDYPSFMVDRDGNLITEGSLQ